MKKTLTAWAAASLMLAASSASAAVYFDEDLNFGTKPLTGIPLSQAAEADFLALLSGTGTETFESLTGKTGAFDLTFPGSTGDLTAALNGNGAVRTLAAGAADQGRYSVPAGSSTNYLEVAGRTCTPTGCPATGGFEITFSQSVAAFGFYGIDIGDFEGQLSIEFVREDGTSVGGGPVEIQHSLGLTGSVLFFGFVADSVSDLFRTVRFLTTDAIGQSDVFAFDNMTVGTYCQVAGAVDCGSGGGGSGGGGGGGGGEGGGGEPNPVPEPTSLALALAALAGLRLSRRRATV